MSKEKQISLTSDGQVVHRTPEKVAKDSAAVEKTGVRDERAGSVNTVSLVGIGAVVFLMLCIGTAYATHTPDRPNGVGSRADQAARYNALFALVANSNDASAMKEIERLFTVNSAGGVPNAANVGELAKIALYMQQAHEQMKDGNVAAQLQWLDDYEQDQIEILEARGAKTAGTRKDIAALRTRLQDYAEQCDPKNKERPLLCTDFSVYISSLPVSDGIKRNLRQVTPSSQPQGMVEQRRVVVPERSQQGIRRSQLPDVQYTAAVVRPRARRGI